MVSIDTALEAYSPGCYFEPIEPESDGPVFAGFWFENYKPGKDGKPKPNQATLEGVEQVLLSSGKILTIEDGIEGFFAVMQSAAYTKIMTMADDHRHKNYIIQAGIIAVGAMALYLAAPSIGAALAAQAGWQRFSKIARRYRNDTGITKEDLNAFNALVESKGLPEWLKLTF